jgi:hypothetical protein
MGRGDYGNKSGKGGEQVNSELWDYLATDWLDGLAVDIMNKDAQNVFRRLREMSDELIREGEVYK